jgi:hypothetical protein
MLPIWLATRVKAAPADDQEGAGWPVALSSSNRARGNQRLRSRRLLAKGSNFVQFAQTRVQKATIQRANNFKAPRGSLVFQATLKCFAVGENRSDKSYPSGVNSGHLLFLHGLLDSRRLGHSRAVYLSQETYRQAMRTAVATRQQ